MFDSHWIKMSRRIRNVWINKNICKCFTDTLKYAQKIEDVFTYEKRILNARELVYILY